MELDLRPYQEAAVQDVLVELEDARGRFHRRGKRTAVSLSAPTGAGKTIMATAVIERLMFGTGGHPNANPSLRVLWVSDDPALNVQTMDKMLMSSELLGVPSRLKVVDDSVNQKVFEPGIIYFLNTHKLGNGAATFRVGERREYDLWHTIDNTSRDFGTDFLLVIDEAHRGTGTSPGRARAGATILARLVQGGVVDVDPKPLLVRHPAPIVLGISATPERFERLVNSGTSGGGMSLEPVRVSPADVRDSGLVKDRLVLKNPGERQESVHTLLATAVDRLVDARTRWAAHAAATGDPLVDPILVLQVAARENAVVHHYLVTILERDPSLRIENVRHCFEEHATLTFGSYQVRYIEPHRVQDDSSVRLVVFKEALTTGWDCPRAEVMVSVRRAEDLTYITQLVGRMVRTPLAKRVEGDDLLNSVALFLPRFDTEAVNAVVARLHDSDDAVTAETVVNPIRLRHNPSVPYEAFQALAKIPTFTRPAKVATNEVARAEKLGNLLLKVGRVSNPNAEVRRRVVHALRGVAQDHEQEVAARIADLERIDLNKQEVDWLSGEVTAPSASEYRMASDRDITTVFQAAQRKMPSASAKWHWDALCDEMDTYDAKLMVVAVCMQEDARDRVEQAASALIKKWEKEHAAYLSEAGADIVARYREVLESSRVPERTTLVWPSAHGEAADHREYRWPRHLTAAAPRQKCPEDMFPAKVNGWEGHALRFGLSSPNVVAWYRNPGRGAAAVMVPWSFAGGGDDRVFSPDFFFVRRTNDGTLVVDIFDPHWTKEDAAPKWRGLARFAERFGDRAHLGRVWAVIKDPTDGDVKYIDLRDPPTVQTLTETKDSDVVSVFGKHGNVIPAVVA